MFDTEKFLSEIDLARVRRAKELSCVKDCFSRLMPDDTLGIGSKAVVVLAYANWEGFYNDCAKIYVSFLKERGGLVRDTDWMLLVTTLHSDLESIRSRNHSFESKIAFVERLRDTLNCGFDAVNQELIQSKSNLDFKRLSENFSLLNFDVSTFQPLRNHIDKELVGWRHSVAHGDSPRLDALDIGRHIDIANLLLLKVADVFQNAIHTRS